MRSFSSGFFNLKVASQNTSAKNIVISTLLFAGISSSSYLLRRQVEKLQNNQNDLAVNNNPLEKGFYSK